MFEILGYIFKGFIYLWMLIIGSIPNIFMGGLTLCILATALTYLARKNGSRQQNS